MASRQHDTKSSRVGVYGVGVIKYVDEQDKVIIALGGGVILKGLGNNQRV